MRTWLVLLLLLPSAAAQGLYITDENTAAGVTGDTTYVMTDEAPIGDDSFKDYAATAFGALAYTTAFEYTVASDFSAAGPLAWTAYISCDEQTAFRPGHQNDDQDTPTMRVHLFVDGEEVAVDMKYELRTCDGPDDIWEAVFELDASGTEFAAGELVRVENIIWVPTGAPGTGAENVYILGGSLTHPSGLTGPGLPGAGDEEPLPGPGVVHENITDGFRQTFERPHNGTYLFHFNGTDDRSATFSADPAQGNVTVVATAPDGSEALNTTWSVAGNESIGLHNGSWTVRVVHDGFVGEIEMAVHGAPEDEESDPEPDDDTGTGGGDGSESDDDAASGNETGGEDSPAWPLALPLLIALWLRRR